MKTKIALIVLSLTVFLSARAAVQAVLFHVSTNDSFTVPAGKVLLIENMLAQNGIDVIVLQKGTNSVPLGAGWFCSGAGPGPGGCPLKLPLKIPEGWTIQANVQLWPPGADVWVFGVVEDSTDLYAALPNRIDTISVAGSAVSLGIHTASAKPAQVSIEKSPDPAKGWVPATGAAVSRTANPTEYAATLPAEGAKEFFRAKAVPLNK